MKRLLELMLQHPLWVLSLFIACAGALGWQARHFEIDASADTLLTRGNQLYIRTQVMSERFSPQEFLLIGYQPKNHALLSNQTFEDLQTLSRELAQLERVASVRSIRNVPLLTLMDDPLAGGDPMDWTLDKRRFSSAQLADVFDGHPIYEELIINKEQTATALQILFKPNPELEQIQKQIIEIQQAALERELTDDELSRIEQLRAQAEPIEQQLSQVRLEEISQVRELLKPYEKRANVYLGGVHVLAYQLIDIIKTDLAIFGSVIAAVVCLLLLFLFRHPRWLLICIASCTCSVLMTVGIFGLLGFKATVISANFIALQLILTLAIVIHLIVQYREDATANPDWDQLRLVRQTFLKKVKPCFYAGLTTAVGFGSLLFTNIQPVISFGWMMIIAMFFSIVVSLILFPSLMMLFPREEPTGKQRGSRKLLGIATRFAQKTPGIIGILSFGALVAGAVGTSFLTVENSFINYFGKSTDVYRELSFIDQELGGSTPLDIVVTLPGTRNPDPELIVSAEQVQLFQRVQKMLESQEGMGKVLSVVNFTELAREINNGRPLTEYELTALYRTIDESLREDLVGSYFSEPHNQWRLSARIQDATEGLNRAELLDDIHTGMEELGIEKNNYSLTNLFVLYQDILQRLFRSQILALGLVYVVLTLSFCLVFRSVKTGLVAVAPNILSTVSILGVMGWLAIPLDLMTITIASIAMGIAVDDTIHYVDRFQREAKGGTGDQAIERTNHSVGVAILYTSLVVMTGFSLLMFSDFIPTAQFGILTSLAMLMATLWNLTLLPTLLARITGAGHTGASTT